MRECVLVSSNLGVRVVEAHDGLAAEPLLPRNVRLPHSEGQRAIHIPVDGLFDLEKDAIKIKAPPSLLKNT